MGWFYTEYVCGTQLASYRMNATFDRGGQGATGGGWAGARCGVEYEDDAVDRER